MAVLFSGQLNFGDKCLDHQGNQWAVPILAVPNGSPSQLWQLYDSNDGDFNMLYAPSMNMALRTDNLLLDAPWYDENSPQHWFLTTDKLLAGGVGVLTATADGSSVQIIPRPEWSFSDQGAPAQPTDSPYVPAGFQLVWGDDFEGVMMDGCPMPQVDTSKWCFRYSYSGGTLDFLNDEAERFREGENGQPNHIIDNGVLKLTAYPAGSDGTYSSGMIRSKKYFNVQSQTTSFYFETRSKTCGAPGAWPGFWLNGTANADGSLSWPPEIDIKECNMNGLFDGGPNIVHMAPQDNGQSPGSWNNGHWADFPNGMPQGWSWNAPQGEIYVGVPFDHTADFHVYGLLIQPGVAGQQSVNPQTGLPTHLNTIFIDGVACLQFEYDFGFWPWSGATPNGIACRGADVLYDLAIGGRMGGTPQITGPVSEEIDYIRVYQNTATLDGGDATNIVDYPVPATGY